MIHQRRFRVKITVEIDVVTCPGVWLCPYGRVELTFRTLGYHFKTHGAEARFPLLYHEKFHLDGFYREHVTSLSALEVRLATEPVNFALHQRGTRLAFFTGQLGTLLRSTTGTCRPEIHSQVLMRPTQSFPGIIAPKIEIVARVQVLEDTPGLPPKEYYIVFGTHVTRIERPCKKMQDSCEMCSRRRQKPVCHVREAQEHPHWQRKCPTDSDDESVASYAQCTMKGDDETPLYCPFREALHSSKSCGICTEYRNRFPQHR